MMLTNLADSKTHFGA